VTKLLRSYDDNGWLEGALAPMPVADAYSLLSPEREGRIVAERWQHQARRFFETELTVSPAKSYESGGWPRVDHAVVTLNDTLVEVLTLPLERPSAVIDAADAAVVAIGGAGFDALVRRAERLWQVSAAFDGPDAKAPLRLAAVLASLFLAPIVPPGGDSIFGVKGARGRLGG
jgi:hypothetical protein